MRGRLRAEDHGRAAPLIIAAKQDTGASDATHAHDVEHQAAKKGVRACGPDQTVTE